MYSSKLTGIKNTVYKISETEIHLILRCFLSAAIKPGSRLVLLTVHPVYPSKSSREHFQGDQAAMTGERSQVQSAQGCLNFTNNLKLGSLPE